MIEELGSNKYRFRVYVGGRQSRKSFSKTVTCNGKKEAKRLYAKFEEECRKAPLSEGTLEDIIKSYIESKRVQGLAPTTIRGYNLCLNRISSDLKGIKAQKVSPIQIEDFIALSCDKYAPKTICNDVKLMSAAYERAIKLGLLQNNPCKRVTLPKQTQREIQTLSEKEIVELLGKLEEQRLDLKVGYLLCLFCGLRRSEVLGLKEADVDFERKCISIHQTRQTIYGKTSIQGTKTVKSKRTLAVPDFLLDDIKELIEKHHNYPYECSDYLILTAWGEPIHPDTFSVTLKRSIMPNITVHGLRHTFATMLNANGIDIARISAELGHGNIHTTLVRYTHVFGGASASSKGIADSLNKKFGKCAPNVHQIKKSQKTKNPETQ